MKIAIIGSRSINEKDFVFEKLDYLLQNIKEEIVIVSGNAIGLDFIVKEYSTERGLQIIEHLPDYNKYSGKVAPLKQNSKGTAYTINLARKKE